MKLFRTPQAIIIENEAGFFQTSTTDWDGVINADHVASLLGKSAPCAAPKPAELIAVLRKNSVDGAGALVFEGSYLRTVWTKIAEGHNRAVTMLLVEAAV